MPEFTEKEQKWIQNLIQGEDKLLDCGDDKRDLWVTNGYLDCLDMLIKYGNLREPEVEYVPISRVIKVNRKIPKEILKAGRYQYCIFCGVYIVQKVVFVKAEHCESLLKKKLNDNPDIDEKYLLVSSFKTVVFDSGEKWCAFLVKSPFTEHWLGYTSSYWDYPYVSDDESLS